MSTVIDSIMSQLGSLAKLAEGNTQAQKRMRELVLDLINTMVSSIDITEHIPLIKRLLKLASNAESTLKLMEVSAFQMGGAHQYMACGDNPRT